MTQVRQLDQVDDHTVRINLFHSGLDVAGATQLAAALPHARSLHTLWLNDNKALGAAGASAVASALRHAQHLTSLSLNNCRIGDTGARAIAAALQHTPRLQELGLRGNGLGDAGVRVVAGGAAPHAQAAHAVAEEEPDWGRRTSGAGCLLRAHARL